MIDDTIQAVASAPGASARGVLRVSGPAAFAAVARVFTPPPARVRGLATGRVEVRAGSVAAMALCMPGPRSYTGEDVVELHLPGSPLLMALVAEALGPDVRPALPGEFTRRAFENGRIDLTEAEGVLELVHAATAEERRRGLQMLRGGLASGVAAARAALQDALALLEAGLDFTEGETGEVDRPLAEAALERAGEALGDLCAQWPPARGGGEVLLLGATNAGKSSLANALAGRDEALVSERPGTTRDLLRVEVAPGVALLDGPGDLAAGDEADRAALALRDRLAAEAWAALLVVDSTAPWLPATDLPVLGLVMTKCDLVSGPLPALTAAPPAPHFPVSSVTGSGLPELRAFLLQRARGGPETGGAGARAQLSEAAERCAAALRSHRQGVPAEVAAAELGAALSALDRVDGTSSPEDLLDRIFARFCLGK